MIEIEFQTEKDRVKGIARLIRSENEFRGIGKNRLIINVRDLPLLADIKYNICKQTFNNG
jgi:hypothetical protein